MNYGVIGIWNKCAFHYKVLLTLLNPIMILTKFNYFWDLKSVVAQGPKRVTVNATGCGFDLHSKKNSIYLFRQNVVFRHSSRIWQKVRAGVS